MQAEIKKGAEDIARWNRTLRYCIKMYFVIMKLSANNVSNIKELIGQINLNCLFLSDNTANTLENDTIIYQN